MQRTQQEIQTALNKWLNTCLRDWLADDMDDLPGLETVLNALEDVKSDAPTIHETVRMEYEDFLTSQEGPTYDDALGAKIDRETQLYRQMRDAGRI